MKDERHEDANEENRGKAAPSGDDNDKHHPPEQHPESKTSKIEPSPIEKILPVLRGFFSLTGGSILYCFSALSIIYGIVKIIGPILAKSNVLNETLPCIGTLNLYELALLGVLVLIVVWRNVTDDAISLVILIALFLIISGITIDTVASNNPSLVFLVGTASLVVAGVKLWIMRRYVSLRLERFLLVGIILLLAWNFLIAPIMAFVANRALDSVAAFREVWLIGWLTMLASGAMMLLHTADTAAAGAKRHDKNIPFLQTPGMAWVFALAMFLAGGVHQYALTSAFDMQFNFGDFVPATIIVALLSLELMRIYGKKFGKVEIVIALIPLAAISYVILSRSFVEGPSFGVGLFWYPPVLLGITAIAILLLCLRNRWYKLLYVVLTYTFGVMLIVGITPSEPEPFNWGAFGCAALPLFVMGIILRNVGLAIAAVLILSLGGSQSSVVRTFTDIHNLPILGAVGLVAGFGTVIIYITLKEELPRGLAFLGALILSVSAISCFGHIETPPSLHQPTISGVMIAFLGGLVWLYTRDVPVTTILCAPLVWGIYVGLENLKKMAREGGINLEEMKGWFYVVLSFALLAAGAIISLWKGRKSKNADV